MYELPDAYRGKLLCTVDCCEQMGPDRYLEYGKTRIVRSAAGAYREASGEPLSRFGYRFPIANAGRPHMLVLEYPDDRRRYMCMGDGTTYDMTAGVFTGAPHALSHSMLRLENIFWPRWKDCSVMFMTWGRGEPAAVKGFAVYELEELPDAGLPSGGAGGFRSFGIQYEDPCGKGASEGAMTFDEWLGRHIEYMKHTGQNLLVYPINWYHGPQFPSETQPADAFDMVVAADRKQYSRSTTHPPDWLAVLLKRFSEEGLLFTGSMTLLRLGNLLKGMNTDPESIRRGGDTCNNMLWNDAVQSSCGDWTHLYNARNYREYVRWQEEGKSLDNFPWCYGERRGDFHGGPMFNPLHPEVQRQILEYVEEIGRKYGAYPAFRGISVNMWHATLLWFGSLHSGYDDFTAALFERETGISAGADAGDPHRFSKRYERLTFRHRPAWVEWRCRKITEFVARIRDALRKGNPALTLALTFWNETSKAVILGVPNAGTQLGARLGDTEFFREGGADLMELGRLEGVSIAVETNHQRDRGWDTKGVDAPLESGYMFRDHDFLDDGRQDALRAALSPCAFVFNCWVEAWGEHRWFECEPGDPNLPSVSNICGVPAEYVHRMNSYYPEDGFWWDSQLRIVSAFPASEHANELFALALAEYDALAITRGGLYLDKAHTRETLAFAKAYRALPDVKFETVGGSTDPAAVRKLRKDGLLYLYMVNREPYEVTVRVEFSSEGVTLTDKSCGAALECTRFTAFRLPPYGLRVFTAFGDADVTGFGAAVPQEVAEALGRLAEEQMRAFRAIRDAGRSIAGMDGMERDLARAMAQGRYSRARHDLTSYICAKARQAEGLEPVLFG